MKSNIITTAIFLTGLFLAMASCQKRIAAIEPNIENRSSANTSINDQSSDNGANIIELPLSLTIFNPCCQEEVHFTGTIHRVENSNVIHMDSRDISGVGLTSGLDYKVQSVSVRNYQFDPNEYLATLNWSMRMNREDGCGYNVQFVVHVTRDENGVIKTSIHSGNFFCL